MMQICFFKDKFININYLIVVMKSSLMEKISSSLAESLSGPQNPVKNALLAIVCENKDQLDRTIRSIKNDFPYAGNYSLNFRPGYNGKIYFNGLEAVEAKGRSTIICDSIGECYFRIPEENHIYH